LFIRHLSELPDKAPAAWQLLRFTVLELACGAIKFKQGFSVEAETTPD
jgi:hypothetical protein